jgi:hypothetical protein
MSGRSWAGIGLVLLGIVIGVAAASWLQGPRASLIVGPSATPTNTTAMPGPTRTAVGLPIPALTPGSINPNVDQANLASTICLSGWTATIRPPSVYTGALKLVQIIEYGYSDRSPSDYEEDHLVPLELGGAPRDPRNLWPEPNEVTLPDGTDVGSEAKDHLENYLKAAVCSGSIPLGDAQRLIAGDWIVAWQAAGQP